MTKWVTKKLGDCCEVNPHNNWAIPEQFIYIDLESVVSGNLIKEQFISKQEAPSRAQRLVDNGDILYQTVRPYQKNNYLFLGENKKYVASTGYALLRPYQNYESKFIYYLVHTFDFVSQVLGLCTGTSYPAITPSLLKKIEIAVPYNDGTPDLAEQRRIAGILSSADGAIAASEALIEKYRNIKRGLLATLLQPKEGWKKVKLGECLTIGNGQDYKHLHKGDIPVYGTGGVMTYVDDYLYEGETVCIGRKGTINKPIFHCGKIWTVDTLFYTHSYVNVLPLFMYYAFCCIDWLRYNEATGVPSLSKETIYKIEINIPDLAEQRRIAEILSSVDAKIAAEEKVVEKYKGVKKGLMEELMKSEK